MNSKPRMSELPLFLHGLWPVEMKLKSAASQGWPGVRLGPAATCLPFVVSHLVLLQ
jgi:hypothetical protein